MVHSPTHTTGNILDLILTKTSSTVLEVEVLSNEPFTKMTSDHHLVHFTIPFESHNNQNVPINLLY